MDRDDIESALRELAEELDERGIVARIYLVGGAAMVLAYQSRFSTDDVDSVRLSDRRGTGCISGCRRTARSET